MLLSTSLLTFHARLGKEILSASVNCYIHFNLSFVTTAQLEVAANYKGIQVSWISVVVISNWLGPTSFGVLRLNYFFGYWGVLYMLL